MGSLFKRETYLGLLISLPGVQMEAALIHIAPPLLLKIKKTFLYYISFFSAFSYIRLFCLALLLLDRTLV